MNTHTIRLSPDLPGAGASMTPDPSNPTPGASNKNSGPLPPEWQSRAQMIAQLLAIMSASPAAYARTRDWLNAEWVKIQRGE